jgi:gluconate 2-dehydrogenase alpha chain
VFLVTQRDDHLLPEEQVLQSEVALAAWNGAQHANREAQPLEHGRRMLDGASAMLADAFLAPYRYYNRAVSFDLQGESPAYRQHYVDLDPTYRDAWGHPLARITFNFTDDGRRMVKWAGEKVLTRIIARMNPALQEVSNTLADYNVVPYQSTHMQGGAVMGNDSGTSVVNRYGQVWGTPNLFVVGASMFPQNPGYNPTGTVGALAYWTAEALITRYLRAPGPLG